MERKRAATTRRRRRIAIVLAAVALLIAAGAAIASSVLKKQQSRGTGFLQADGIQISIDAGSESTVLAAGTNVGADAAVSDSP